MAHVKVKDLVAAAYAASQGLPPAEAKLMRDVATQLDVICTALQEAMEQNREMAEELKTLCGCKDTYSIC